jgi:hypothetical protein
MKQHLLVLGGALAGGLLGWLAFFWLAGQGLHVPALPGALLGLGAGLPKNRSVVLAGVCGLLATGLGLVAEWRLAPFVKDGGFGFFLLHVHELGLFTLLMIVLGGLIGFWGPYSRIEPRPRTAERGTPAAPAESGAPTGPASIPPSDAGG